jgi:hydroxypyruvate isomerase
MQFSANLGFLWNELDLPAAIQAAADAGFVAVECHWPYDTAADEVNTVLTDTGLPMLGLNTARGNVDAGDNGLSAVPGREAEARAAIDQAIEYAVAINAQNVHVMAGRAEGRDARRTFIENLRYASELAQVHDIGILIEPLNHYDAPGYFLRTSAQARSIIEEVAADNLKLMFDCYHLQIMEGDISRRLEALLPIIGHIQVAAVPDRGEPDSGELDYRHIMLVLQHLDYAKPIGAEYKPRATTEQGLGWLSALTQNTIQ